MKRPGIIVALALTWDGARYPTRSLPAKARSFLAGKSTTYPSQKKMATIFSDDHVKEIRVCWVPTLRGGNDVLCETFSAPMGKRLSFQSARAMRFGDILGVVYRRSNGK